MREFIYLDEVSVYSLLSSKKHGIATQFTESQTASLNSEMGSSFNIGFAGIGSQVNAKSHANQAHSSQVIRKATVQTSFTELHDLVRGSLHLVSPDRLNHLTIESMSDIERHFDALARGNWVVDVAALSRGSLLEARVELEADPLFRIATVITTLYELMADSPDLFGSVPIHQVKEVYSIGQVLDRMLTGLVPLRGRLLDFETTNIDGKTILVHRSVIDKLGVKYADAFIPVYVTGTAQQDLFWKDLRQVLFSKSHYSVFCRLATEGLKIEWQPIRVVDLFEGMVPDFRGAITSVSEMARQVTSGQGNIETPGQSQGGSLGVALVREYVRLLEEFHCQTVSAHMMEDRIIPSVPSEDWHTSVTGRRAVLDGVTKLVEEEFGRETPGEARLALRNQLSSDTDLTRTLSPAIVAETIERRMSEPLERYLDTEIVAIHW